MKEIYDWVPWFRELVRRIADEGEAYLNEKARQVDWGENLAQLEYGDEGIDPFSFLYFLASKAGTNQLKAVYESVSQEFAIRSPLPDSSVYEYYIFPTPQPRYSGFYVKTDSGYELLWELFIEAREGKVSPENFENALKLNGVGFVNLTQTLFLINPKHYQPVDNLTDDLSEALELRPPAELGREIKKAGGYEEYLTFLKKLNSAFPGCEPYEINMFLFLRRTGQISVSDGFYHVSTQVHGHNKGEFWDNTDDNYRNYNFKENNWVYTGGPGDEREYRLADPKPGDIILVRTGREAGKGLGRAIGVVYQNDYPPDGWAEEHRIHVLWVNKSDVELAGNTAILGFGKAGSETETYKAFEGIKSYESSFELLKQLRGDSIDIDPQTATGDLQPRADNIEHPHPLNQILYGPPGTGKTWNTVAYALAIVEDKPLDEIERMERKDKLRRFYKLKDTGQIGMVTFHQNYNYEDFIEGIRPVLDDDGSGSVNYKLVPGVFRRIVKQADENTRQPEQKNRESWDIDELLQAFAEWIDGRLKSGEQIDLNVVDRKSGNKRIVEVIWSGDETFESIKAGIEDNPRNPPRNLTRDIIKRDYRAFYEGEIKSIEDIKSTGTSSKHWAARYYFGLYQKMKEFHDEEWQPNEQRDIASRNHVLIIDEINRGNIAKIFGELITLIEPSRRIGADDETTVTLPYSKNEFGVPDNLYIIGTMNTADRSIALLDTALRRRFVFIEMMPDPELVPKDVGGVDCQKLLEAMNKRIRFLLDREHQIGHTYFMKIKDMDSLASTFQNQIMPLLQEYFYDNWEKIRMVLNKNGFIVRDKESERLRKDLLTKFPEHDSTGSRGLIDEQSKIYELLSYGDGKWKEKKSYINICDNGRKDDASETEQDA